MNKFILFLVLFIIILSPIAYATEFTPQGDVNLRGVYQIYNATNMTASYFIGDGSKLTGVVAAGTSVNWTNVIGKPTNLSEFTDDLGDRGYTNLSNFTDDINYSSKNVNSSIFWNTLSSIQSSWFYDLSNVLTFNETKLNSTIDARATGSSYNFQCPSGQFVINLTSVGGYTCEAAAGSGDITSVQSDNLYIYNGSNSGDVYLLFNETKLNSTIDARAVAPSGLNSTNGIYLYDILNKVYFNESKSNETMNLLINAVSTLDSTNIASLNWTKLQNYPSACSAGYAVTEVGDSIICTEFILGSEESNLNVNHSVSSDSATSWASMSSIQSKWFSDLSNVLTFDEVELNSTIDARDSDTTYNFQCTAGNFVKNLSSGGGYVCDAPSGSGDITSVQGGDAYIYNGSDSGDVVLRFNTTALFANSLGSFVDNLGDRGYTALSNFTDDLGNRGYTALSNFTDDLGNRGYTHLSNFTDDIVYSIKNVNSSAYWDGLNTPSDIDASDITDDGTYALVSGETFTGHVTVPNMTVTQFVNYSISNGNTRVFANGCYEKSNSTGIYIIC